MMSTIDMIDLVGIFKNTTLLLNIILHNENVFFGVITMAGIHWWEFVL
jgi:hypothetical protein